MTDSTPPPSDERDPPADDDVHAGADVTLGGYFETHDRPPAFEGVDGQPYTVSVEVEKTANLKAPYVGYLVFPRWAETGVGIVGHVETPVLWEGTARDDVLAEAGATPLLRVKGLLDEAIRRKTEGTE
ncbi:MAG: hypothetical protein KY453_06550 [Gemmatimonadetes bacterium]|nr:hypothetical protein [Gemmatimonadota bacterium]